jgi:hypothetical protein
LHGLIEKFITLSPNPEQEIITLCNDSSNKGSCYHGLGHGIMIYKDYNVVKSVKICGAIYSTSYQISCCEGLFMELFDSESVAELDDKNVVEYKPREICSSYNALYQDTCYYYAGRYWYNTIQIEKD